MWYRKNGGNRMEFKLRLADIPIRVHSQYDSLKEYCKDYVIEEEPGEIEIWIPREDVEREQENVQDAGYTMQYLETLALLRKISEVLPERDVFLMHGAVISWRGDAYMFTAPSGTGKSTHVALWRKYLGEEVQVINGDKPFLSVSQEEVRVYGTPWAGKERWQNNTSGTLKGICILAQAKENKIRRLDGAEALPYLLRQIHFTENTQRAGRVLDLLDQMLKMVPVWYLECDISKEAVKTSFESMTRNV